MPVLRVTMTAMDENIIWCLCEGASLFLLPIIIISNELAPKGVRFRVHIQLRLLLTKFAAGGIQLNRFISILNILWNPRRFWSRNNGVEQPTDYSGRQPANTKPMKRQHFQRVTLALPVKHLQLYLPALPLCNTLYKPWPQLTTNFDIQVKKV